MTKRMNNTLKFAIYIVVFSFICPVGEKLLGYQNTIVDRLPFTCLLWLILVGVFYIFFYKKTRRNSPKATYQTNVRSSLLLSICRPAGFAAVK